MLLIAVAKVVHAGCCCQGNQDQEQGVLNHRLPFLLLATASLENSLLYFLSLLTFFRQLMCGCRPLYRCESLWQVPRAAED